MIRPGTASGMDLTQALTRPFLDVGGVLAEALLYLDAGAGEAVASILGLQGLEGPILFSLFFQTALLKAARLMRYHGGMHAQCPDQAEGSRPLTTP